MNPSVQTLTGKPRVCLLCEKTHDSEDSFCSDPCRTKFLAWLETEHAAVRGKRPKYWNMIRRFALERDGNRCQICGDEKELSVHHLVPLSDGGDSTARNLLVLCHSCHQRIHGKRKPENGRRKKFHVRIRYQPLYVPEILAYSSLWE
ncbi:MAG: HNH endonuclease [Methanospirillum sp.]|nr:HNH endonuclease [Methanospirillum sp.]